MIGLNKSSTYRSFVNQRNKALEEILQKRLIQVDAILDELEQVVIDIASGYLAVISNRDIKQFEMRIDPVFELASVRAVDIMRKLRRSAYALAYAGENEAIARATAKKTDGTLTKAKVDQIVEQPLVNGGTMDDRMRLYFGRLKRRIIDAMQYSLSTGEDVTNAVRRLRDAFPPKRVLRRPRRNLKPVKAKEADGDTMDDRGMLFQFGSEEQRDSVSYSKAWVDPEVWDSILGEYTAEYVPTGRGPGDKVKYPYTAAGKTKWKSAYQWEVEKDITHDFVNQVRAGQKDAANENGYTDFVWIAIVDNKTDKCCLKRDGLTTKEIEKQVKRWTKEERCNDAIVPPAHFNCRCDLAPVTDDLPEKPIKDLGDFETWLK